MTELLKDKKARRFIAMALIFGGGLVGFLYGFCTI